MLRGMVTGSVRTWGDATPFERLCRSVGGKAKLAKALGISRQALFCWGGIVPEHQLDQCVRLANGLVTAQDLRPDLFTPIGYPLLRRRRQRPARSWDAARRQKESAPKRRRGRPKRTLGG